MTIDDITQLIEADKSRTLELKKSTGELKEAMHTACAFLNTDGGWLIFGITPSSLKIVGQDVSDQTQRELSQALSYLEPAVDVRVEYIDVPNSSNQKIVAIHFDGWVWGKEPYTYRGCPYYKVESTTKVMPREMFEERLRASKPHKMSWERQIAEGFPVSKLNEKHIMDAVRLGVRGGRMPASAQSLSIEEILLRFSLMKDGQLLQAAIALFASDVQDYPQLLMRMARFKGNDKMEFVDSQQVRGDFFDMLDAGIAFCFKHLNVHGKIVGLRREETLDIPVEALREALINALCHRSYDSISGSVSLAIYDDRIEIEYPGRFPVGITPENIKQPHDSKPFNPLMAETLYKCTWLESWGSGVVRMVNACQMQGVPEPYYEVRPGGIVIIFRRKADYVNTGGDSDVDTGGEIQLSERQQDILAFIRVDGDTTATKMAKLFGISKRTVDREISFLRRNGYIRKETKDNRSPWVVVKES